MSHIPNRYHWQRDAPRLVRRFYWWMILLPSPVVVVLLTAGYWSDFLAQFSTWTFSAMSFGLVVSGGLWVAAIRWWEKRLLQQLRAADYKLCPQCRFVLKGHKGDCNCPECGEACDVEMVQAAWRSFRPIFTSADDRN